MNNNSFTTIDPVLRLVGLDSTSPKCVLVITVRLRLHIHIPVNLARVPTHIGANLAQVPTHISAHLARVPSDIGTNLARLSTHIHTNLAPVPVPVPHLVAIHNEGHVAAHNEGEIISHVVHNQREIVHPDHNPHGLGNIIVFTIIYVNTTCIRENTHFRVPCVVDTAPAIDWECVFLGVLWTLIGFMGARIFAHVWSRL
ncbi:hypothetical protein B0H19DRAFT_1260774 [Mycena capillaripes]|nr:hypothetical protein B0H19DRAFT_1260774 [Mycena capillaripes]